METIKVKLTKPHTDSGRDYPAGAVIELSPADAQWLIQLDSAKPAPATTKEK